MQTRRASRVAASALAALTAHQLIYLQTAHAGSGQIAPKGETSLTYTYVLKPTDPALTAPQIASIRTALETASRHVCRATDGLIKVTQWTVNPGESVQNADVVAFPTVQGRAHADYGFGAKGKGVRGARVTMYMSDFADGDTIGHELGHFILALPDEYEEARRGGGPLGIGGMFDDLNANVAKTQTDNTMMESQFALTAAGLEYQLTYDAVFDRNRGNDDANDANNEPFPAGAATTVITVPFLNLGTSGTARAVDLTNLQTAIDTSVARQTLEVTDQSLDPMFKGTSEPTNTEAYTWGANCDFGRGSIRTWLFLEWTGGSKYKLIVAAEERQFTGPDNEKCTEAKFNTIAMRRLASYDVEAGTPGCGDGVLGVGEECEPTLVPTPVPCTRIPGSFTSTTATTTCNPATCTFRRTGCYAGSTASCGPLNILAEQCYVGFGGELTLDPCPAGGGTQSCTDCLDDPAACPRTMGAIREVKNNNTPFNVPNTAASIAAGAGATFPVRLNVQTLSAGGASTFSATADGRGSCELVARRAGLCETAGATAVPQTAHKASCVHVCGEIWSPAGTGAFQMTDSNRAQRYSADSYWSTLRCINRDVGNNNVANAADCAITQNYAATVSEWDIVQNNLRNYDLDKTLLHNTEPLGTHGDQLKWGRAAPAVEGPGTQDCTSYMVKIDVLPPFNPNAPGVFDTSLVIDTSGSMATIADKMKTRADLATTAGTAALQMLNNAQTASMGMTTYNVAITSFSDTPVGVLARTSDTAAGLVTLTNALKGRAAPAGNTAIGDALRSAYGQLNATAPNDRFLMLVSDGFHNTGERPETVAKALMTADPRLHICPVYFGEAPDQSEELASVAREGKCSLRIADPNTNDITATMFEAAGERAGGSVLMSDRVTINGTGSPGLLSTILSSLSSATAASTELVVAPEMKNIRLLVSDSGRNAATWTAPTVTLTSPTGAKTILDASTAVFNETANGYRMFQLPISAASQAGKWKLDVTPPANASSAPIMTNLSVVADRSDAACAVRLNRVSVKAGAAIEITVAPTHVLPFNIDSVSASAHVIGPSHDGTVRKFPLTLARNRSARNFTTRFNAPAQNGIYHVQALCEASKPYSDVAEGKGKGVVTVTAMSPFRVQGASEFVVKEGTFVCRSATDCDGDGVLNTNEPAGDADGDGIPNANESDADDDGVLDKNELGKDADADGVTDMIDADMNNDGIPDWNTKPCAWTTWGGDQTRNGKSVCRGSTAASPTWTNSQVGTYLDGVTMDKSGTTYFNATTNVFLQQSVVAVGANGVQKWAGTMPFAATTPVEVVEDANIVAAGDANGEVVAFDSTGKVVWTHYTDFPVMGLISSGGRIYASTLLGGLYAIDAYTGRRLWAQTSFLVPWGYPALSPDGATLYVTYGVGMVAVETATGVVKWARVFPMTFLNTLMVAANGDVYMGALDNALYRFSGATGAQVWRYPVPIGSTVFGHPVVDGSNIYFGTDAGMAYALKDGTTPTVLWSRNLGSAITSLPSKSSDGIVYFGTLAGVVYGLNTTSSAVMWQKTVPGTIGTSIAIGNKRVVFGDSTSRVYSY